MNVMDDLENSEDAVILVFSYASINIYYSKDADRYFAAYISTISKWAPTKLQAVQSLYHTYIDNLEKSMGDSIYIGAELREAFTLIFKTLSVNETADNCDLFLNHENKNEIPKIEPEEELDSVEPWSKYGRAV